MRTNRERVLALTGTQAGAISAGQLAALRVDSAGRWRMLKDGFLVRHAHCYVVSSAPRTANQRLWLAVLESGGILSHRTAAQLLAGRPVHGQLHVLVPHSRTGQQIREVVVHRTRRLPGRHTTSNAAGLLQTVAPRTFVDLAAPACGVTDEQLVSYLDAWMIERTLSMSWLRWWLEHESQWLPGRTRAAALLHQLGDARVDSLAERRLVNLLEQAELTPFATQHEIRRGDRTIGRVDFAWPRCLVALELDGYQFHSGPRRFVADRRRGNAIELAGWMLLRTTPTEVRDDPDTVVAAVRAALDLRSAGRRDQ